ncbi:MAG: hypothetical protein Q7T40_01525 [Methylobacter sp.]|nr:hypothetical protein [Methylobacter sp.]
MRLSQRLLTLERIAYAAEMPIPAIIMFKCDGAFTDEQQQQIAEAEANGQPVIIFNIIDASIAGGDHV